MTKRFHGRKGRLYTGLASDTAEASPVPVLSSISIGAEVDQEEVTAFGDTNKVYLAGLPDVSGSFDGYLDADSNQLWTAALDGLGRKTYLYPSIEASQVGTYWFGRASFSFEVEIPVDGAASISGDWTATDSWSKVQA